MSFDGCNSTNLYFPDFKPAEYSPFSFVVIVRYCLPPIFSKVPTGLLLISNASDSFPESSTFDIPNFVFGSNSDVFASFFIILNNGSFAANNITVGLSCSAFLISNSVVVAITLAIFPASLCTFNPTLYCP